MPYDLTWETAGAYAHFHGTVDADDIKRFLLSIVGDARFDSLKYLICDYLDVTSHTVSLKDAEEAASLDFAQRLTNSRFAHIALAAKPENIALIKHWIESTTRPERNFHCTSVAEARELASSYVGALPKAAGAR